MGSKFDSANSPPFAAADDSNVLARRAVIHQAFDDCFKPDHPFATAGQARIRFSTSLGLRNGIALGTGHKPALQNVR